MIFMNYDGDFYHFFFFFLFRQIEMNEEKMLLDIQLNYISVMTNEMNLYESMYMCA